VVFDTEANEIVCLEGLFRVIEKFDGGIVTNTSQIL
jgi:hypothetical protein